MAKKREIEWKGRYYKVKSDAIDMPDLYGMEELAAAVWLNRNTYPRGYSKTTNPLEGFGGAITVTVK